MALEPQARAVMEMVKRSRMLRLLLASTVLAWLLTCMSGAWRWFPSHSFLQTCMSPSISHAAGRCAAFQRDSAQRADFLPGYTVTLLPPPHCRHQCVSLVEPAHRTGDPAACALHLGAAVPAAACDLACVSPLAQAVGAVCGGGPHRSRRGGSAACHRGCHSDNQHHQGRRGGRQGGRRRRRKAA